MNIPAPLSKIKKFKIINILDYIGNENFKYKLFKYSKAYQNKLNLKLSDYKKKYFEQENLKSNKIFDNYNNYSQCLMKIKDNQNLFKKNSHSFIFCYLLGYYSKNNINIDDFNNILNNYQNHIFSLNDFFLDFKTISKIFFNYFIKSSQKNLNNNNINENLNIIKNSNNNQNKSFNNNIQNKSFNNNIQNKSFNNNIQKDYEMAKQIEEQELIMNKIHQEQEASKQIKKCEICLEDFSLLDYTNYFLNCNCVFHNKCFDEMVKSAINNNSLPVKCPNCGTPIHPNFIEDSIRNANPQLIEKYDKFSMNNFIQNNNDNYSSCPTPGCEYLFFFNPGEFNFLCPLCNKHYCLNCRDEWHVNLTCQQYRDCRDEKKLDEEFFKFVKGAKFKMCPKCKYWVEKNQGCDHMRCRCGADFCYLCGKLYNNRGMHNCNIKKNYYS